MSTDPIHWSHLSHCRPYIQDGVIIVVEYFRDSLMKTTGKFFILIFVNKFIILEINEILSPDLV